MGKVIKNVVKTVVAAASGLLLLVLVLPLAASLLISVPAVQNAVVQRLVTRLSQRIGTRVSVDNVRLRLVNRVEIDGFYVEDFGGDTLLYVPRLVAPLEDTGLGDGQLTFGRVRLTGAQLWLRKAHAHEEMNIRGVVNAIRGSRPPNPDPRFRMRISAIEADSLTFGLLRNYKERREDRVDFSRFVMRDVHARIEDFTIAGDTIRMDILSLGGTERSGWAVDDLEAHPLVVSRGAVTLTDVDIRSQGSELNLPAIRLVGGSGKWADFGGFTDSVAMEITIRGSRVTGDLAGRFVPAVRSRDVVLDDVSIRTHGVLSALAGRIGSARTLGTTFSLDFTSRGLPRLRDTRADIRLTGFESAGSDVAALVRSVTGRELPGDLAAVLSRLGGLSLTGGVTGLVGDFTAAADLITAAGNVDLEARVTTGEGGATIDGRLSTGYFELGRTLASKDLGALAGVFTAAGTIPRAPAGGATVSPSGPLIHGAVQGEISALMFRGYTYHGLDLDAAIDGRNYSVSSEIRDPALEAALEASLDLSDDRIPRYTLDLDLQKMDLAATHFDRGDSVSVLSGRLVANLSGRGLDDAGGTVELLGAAYRSERGAVETGRATLSAQNNADGNKLISLRSEFADGEARSRTGYRDMLTWLSGFLQRYIPMSGRGAASGAADVAVPPDGGDPSAMSNYSIVSVNIKNTDRLFEVLAPGAAIAKGAAARFMFNPYTGSFSLSAASDFIEYGGVLAADISLTADNAADSLTVYLSGTDIYSGRGHISRFELHGGAGKGQRADVALDGKVWRIASDSLWFGSGRAGIRNLALFSTDNPEQRLTATGVVSRFPSDTLHVRLNSFDLSPFWRLAMARGGRIDLTGRATGRLDVASMVGAPKIDADIDIPDLAVNGHQAPPMKFTSLPDSNAGVRYRLVNEASGDDLVRGTLSPRGEIEAAVRADAIDAALLDPLLGGVLEDTRGEASARLTLGGTFRSPRARGYIDIPHLETTVGYTRARYGVDGARISVENSVLNLPRTPVANPLGGTGDLAMRIDMANLRDIGVEIDARANAMLVFDTGPGDSESFYGRVFATGSVGIRSGAMGTRMDISGRSDAGTRFHLPLNAKSNVSWADFVVFADRRAEPDSTDVLARKRLAYERRIAVGERAGRTGPMELNLIANVTPDAEVHMLIDPNLGQGITGRGEGVIDLRIDPASGRFTMTGDYDISSGKFEFSMMDVFNKTFEITPGSTLRWSGEADDALLSVDASLRMRTSLLPLIDGSSGISGGSSVQVDCIIRLRERLSAPEITFDIVLPFADPEVRQIVANAMNTQELKSMQFLSLLTTGSFATRNSITGQAASAGVAATGAVGFDILTNQLNNFLSSGEYDIFFRYRPQENFATTQFDVGFSTGFLDNRIQLEIEGNYVDNRTATSVGTADAANLAGDVSLTWVIDRAGNLRLKVFSQTIDRLNETQGLQENGLGIYYKKNFDRIRDIFRRRASRPKRLK